MSYALSLTLGAILGFSAHRAGICTVKAVAEVLTTRRAHFLWSFAKTALWVMAAAALAGALALTPGWRHWPLSAASVAGGVVFGLGAGLNGGCTFSTLSRLTDGNLNLLATVLGWPVGLALGLRVWAFEAASPQATAAGPGLALSNPLTLLLALWALWEGGRLIRRMARGGSVGRVLGAHTYTLSAAAALLGLANAGLLLNTGPWSFTGTILCAMDAGTLANCHDPLLPWLIFAAALAGMAASAWQRGSLRLRWLIFAAALAGMAASAWQRGSLRLRWPRARAVLRHATAGVMMGLGAAFIPGGNEGLILFGAPSLSPHAFPAYGGIVLGILLALLAMRAAGRTLPPIICDGDICRARL